MEKHRKGKILAILFTGVLMGALDISIVGPALPSIEQTIRVDHKSLSWIFSIYVLFNLVGVSFLSRLSDIHGRRSVYMLSVLLFATGSAIVAFASDMTVLLIGRAIQGFGASGIFPVASAVIGDIYPQEKRGKALGMIGAVFGLAFIIGPLIAGLMLRFFSWNSLFLINLQIAIVVLYFSRKYLPSVKSISHVRFDWPGMLFLAIFLSSFVYGINSIRADQGISGILTLQVLPFFLTSMVSLGILIFFERKASAPILKLSLFNSRQVRIVVLVALGAGLLQSVTLFVPDMAVQTYKVTASDASFMLIPFVIAVAIGAPVSGRMVDKFGSRIIVIAGLVSSGTGLFLLYLAMDSLLIFYTGGILMGLGTSMLQGSSMRYIMLNEVQSSDRAMGQGLITLFTSVGQMTGATYIGVIVASEVERTMGYRVSFLTIAMITILIILSGLWLKSRNSEFSGT